jgi:hypothetical protein
MGGRLRLSEERGESSDFFGRRDDWSCARLPRLFEGTVRHLGGWRHGPSGPDPGAMGTKSRRRRHSTARRRDAWRCARLGTHRAGTSRSTKDRELVRFALRQRFWRCAHICLGCSKARYCTWVDGDTARPARTPAPSVPNHAGGVTLRNGGGMVGAARIWYSWCRVRADAPTRRPFGSSKYRPCRPAVAHR